VITVSTTEGLEDDGANTAEVNVDGAGLGLGLGLLSWIFILGKNQRGLTWLTPPVLQQASCWVPIHWPERPGWTFATA